VTGGLEKSHSKFHNIWEGFRRKQSGLIEVLSQHLARGNGQFLVQFPSE
jgi:hypothetical protein